MSEDVRKKLQQALEGIETKIKEIKDSNESLRVKAEEIAPLECSKEKILKALFCLRKAK